ncbi:MAG TPA: hypothetical protein VLB79_12775, partial [Solirubrobacterales bacterium]|nr:hypothetical protein [Solirubrobacterales bacterium]
MLGIAEFTAEQKHLWDEYAEACARVLASGRPYWEAEVVSGFQVVCQLEGIDVPSEAAIRAAVRTDETPL